MIWMEDFQKQLLSLPIEEGKKGEKRRRRRLSNLEIQPVYLDADEIFQKLPMMKNKPQSHKKSKRNHTSVRPPPPFIHSNQENSTDGLEPIPTATLNRILPVSSLSTYDALTYERLQQRVDSAIKQFRESLEHFLVLVAQESAAITLAMGQLQQYWFLRSWDLRQQTVKLVKFHKLVTKRIRV